MVTASKTRESKPVSAIANISETRDWLTRYEASDLLCCSLQTLANYERKGLLHPRRAYRPDGRGVEHLVIVYSPQEVHKLGTRMNRPTAAARDAGEMAGRAFDLFAEDKTDSDVVRALRLTIENVRELREKWVDGGGSHVVVSTDAKESLEKIVGPFKTVTDLVERLAASVIIVPDTKKSLEKIVGPFSNASELVARVSLLKT